jgi:cellulose synthase/poly-beta-1,6-N-acetylglucosamine synthase-like glycosyltransferase
MKNFINPSGLLIGEKEEKLAGRLRLAGIRLRYVLVFFLVLAFLIYVPQALLGLLIINLTILVFVSLSQLYASLLPERKIVKKALPEAKPFVSIHIPTHNEPPHLVKGTLEALSGLDYPNYEVIVLDNNTKDSALWGPVGEVCHRLGERFKFFHIENLSGFKAGALNKCYALSHPQADYILVIDADYQVDPNLLNEALSYFSSPDIALVQFPQAYRNASVENEAMNSEYEHFFDVYMNMANVHNCVLSTGTVSVIRKQALAKAGLWSNATITEDVEMGLRLHENGYKGVYVPVPLGKGLMPTDLKSLKNQRERWVFGNMQTLACFFKMDKTNLGFRQSIGIFTQLTAWFNFMLIPVITLMGIGLFLPWLKELYYVQVASLALTSLWFNLVFKFAFFGLLSWKKKRSLSWAWKTFRIHMGLSWEGASSWLRFFVKDNLLFKRTNKFLVSDNWRPVLPNLCMFGLMVLAGIMFFRQQLWGLSLFCLLASPFFLMVLFVKRVIYKTFKQTHS